MKCNLSITLDTTAGVSSVSKHSVKAFWKIGKLRMQTVTLGVYRVSAKTDWMLSTAS